MADGTASRGYDDLEFDDRRKLCRDLIDRGTQATPDEETELSVLLLMGLGMTETQARGDVRLRKRQNKAAKRKLPW